jgi:hypothetical protein
MVSQNHEIRVNRLGHANDHLDRFTLFEMSFTAQTSTFQPLDPLVEDILKPVDFARDCTPRGEGLSTENRRR